ncbi:MAG: hypothetical protein R8K47_05655 [Mariprofundaceae bacterium]
MNIYMLIALCLSLLTAVLAWALLRGAAGDGDADLYEEIDRWLDEGRG